MKNYEMEEIKKMNILASSFIGNAETFIKNFQEKGEDYGRNTRASNPKVD